MFRSQAATLGQRAPCQDIRQKPAGRGRPSTVRAFLACVAAFARAVLFFHTIIAT
ncbi:MULTISPECIES: hypothetical protein [unclassified Streptomyces]|uniref:hypothetical protein n=1 Tax=unclassified Streptomyces TaxID=2593676 RepID=UPI00131B2E83|nr:hypothetical protein [Streptomyces sp. CB01373]